MNVMNTIVFVEDDPEVGSLIAAYLAKHDIEVLIEPRGDLAEETILRTQPELVLLDIMLPGKDGMTICRDLRGRWQGPIVLLTSLDSDMNHILALEMGACDYILKTTPPAVLLARLRLHLRQNELTAQAKGIQDTAMTPHKTLRFGALIIDPVNRSVALSGEPAFAFHRRFRITLGTGNPCRADYGSRRAAEKLARRQLRRHGPQRGCRYLKAA